MTTTSRYHAGATPRGPAWTAPVAMASQVDRLPKLENMRVIAVAAITVATNTAAKALRATTVSAVLSNPSVTCDQVDILL